MGNLYPDTTEEKSTSLEETVVENTETEKPVEEVIEEVVIEEVVIEEKVEQPTPPKPKTVALTIKEAVNECIANSTSTVRAIVVKNAVDAEVDKRAKILTKALDALKKLGGELNRIKPDVIAYDENGKEVSSNWTKDALKSKKETTEKFGNLNKLIEKAMSDKATNDDWAKLANKC